MCPITSFMGHKESKKEEGTIVNFGIIWGLPHF